MSSKLQVRLFAAALLLLESAGCAKLFGNLRRDLDDSKPEYEPTVGGVYPEGGYLGDPYGRVGHRDRAPASMSNYGDYVGGARSWVNPDVEDANLRDRARAGVAAAAGLSYGDQPNLAPPVKRQYKNGARATREDFMDTGGSEGSLWASDGQTNYYFTKNKVRGLGDLVQIKLEDPIMRDVGNELKRTLTEDEAEAEVASAQLKATKPTDADKSRAPATAGAAEKKPTAEEESKPKLTLADVDLTKNLEIKAGDTVMGEIVERFPNGNYKVMANKRIPYKGGYRLMTMVGVIRSGDLEETEVVPSGKLYEYRLKVLR